MPTRTALSVLLVAIAVLLVAAMPPPAPIFSQELQLSPPASPDGNRDFPAIAYNSLHNEYLVVWHNKWSGAHYDVYARRVTAAGQLKTWFAVSVGTNSRFQPAVAYNPVNDNYLVVWAQDPGDGVHYEIWGRIVAWNGASMGTEFQILAWPNRQFVHPRVVWNTVHYEYLMVANGVDTSTWKANDITGRRVSAAGAQVGGVLVYQNPTYLPQEPSLIYNAAADEYLVTWIYSASPGNYDIHGARVAGNGTFVNRSDFIIDSSTDDQDSPVVATNGQGRYLVVWQQYVWGDWDIYGRELNVNGDPVTAPYAIQETGANETNPVVAGNFGPATSTDYTTVWQQQSTSGYEIWARRYGSTVYGVSASSPFQVAAVAFWDNKDPAIAIGAGTYLIAYAGISTGVPTAYQHIYGTVWSPNGVFLPLTRR